MITSNRSAISTFGVIDLLPDSPLRPADWRWQLAIRLQKSKHLSSILSDLIRKDEALHRAYLFAQQNSISVSDGDNVRFEILAKWPNLTQAHNIHFHNMSYVPQSLQAWVVTGEKTTRIADRMGIHPQTMAWYEKVFFDVRDRLDVHGYVINVILGEKHHFGMTERDYGLLWKFIAFIGGPIALEAFQNKSYGTIRPSKPEDLPQFIKDSTKGTLHIKSAIAARTVNLSPLTIIPLLELWGKLTQMDVVSGADSGVSGIVKAVGEALSSLPHKTGTTAVQHLTSTMPRIGGKHYHQLQAELSGDETASLVSTGQYPAGVEEITFPASGGKKDDSHLFHEVRNDD